MNFDEHIHALMSRDAERQLTPPPGRPREQRQPSLYMSLLQAPTSLLAGNVMDRADVSGIAILGYN
ncbi:hypothetical protein PTE30175_02270 [Pandoraea terrae]|uniref:Uncharacterized protein n=1 Tax=Pandoraea terrae TaxID=1537710 RepID=A0A5E4UYV4_9BURK|nr:hypothetical protein [Pandoraea terrae]VVE05158.1 hypothetical protein PTE30175_02270 [Pandoraea terrae]